MILGSARCLVVIYIYIKFREDSLNGFQVLERRGYSAGKSSKENNSKSINARVMVLCSARCLMLIDIYMKFYEVCLNVFFFKL